MKSIRTAVSVLLIVLSGQVMAEKVSMVIGLALPPYVIAERDTGMELEIVREALAMQGHELVPLYVPFWRVLTMLGKGAADAAMTVNESSGVTNVYYSDSHITYQNQVIALKDRNYSINSINDLTPYSILAFQNANKYLGEEYRKVVSQHPFYQEVARQAKQVTMLYSGRIDLVVMDKNIFDYYRQLELRVPTAAAVQRYELFPPSLYKVAFASETVRDDFNKSLKLLRDSGRYQAIIERYVGDQAEKL